MPALKVQAIALAPSDPSTPTTSRLKIALLAFALLSSGLITNVAFEALSKLEPGCSGVLTLCQYLTALVGCMGQAGRHLSQPAIPLRCHLVFTTLMFLTAYCGNASVDFQLPFPLYLIIKSSNLVASMAVGAMAGKTYSRGQFVAVLAITVGVVMATLVSSAAPSTPPSTLPAAPPAASTASTTASGTSTFSLLLGASLCAASTLCMALLGVTQEATFAK